MPEKEREMRFPLTAPAERIAQSRQSRSPGAWVMAGCPWSTCSRTPPRVNLPTGCVRQVRTDRVERTGGGCTGSSRMTGSGSNGS